MRDDEPNQPRIPALFAIIVVVIIWALISTGGIQLFTPKPIKKSEAFLSQAKAAVDAIHRYEDASGISVSIAKLDAEREFDKLGELGKSSEERNAVQIIQNYQIAVSRAWLESRAFGGHPSSESIAAMSKAYFSALDATY